MGDGVFGAHAITLVLPSFKIVNRRFFNFTGHAGYDHVAAQTYARLTDRLDCRDIGCHGALHVEGAHAIDPFVVDDGALALVADTTMSLLGAERGIQMAVEHD